MRSILIAVLFATILAACTKPGNEDSPFKTGTYNGTFQRLGYGNERIAAVTLQFSPARFSGSGEVVKYPALCRGKYDIEPGNKIDFRDDCVWTAEFDWTLILSGKFDYSIEGDTVVMTRNVGTYTDIYKLGINK